MKFNDIKETFSTTPKLVILIKKYSKGRNLDVGCGTGAYFKYFKGNEIYGIDLEESYFKSIDVSKLGGKKIVLKKADMREIPFKNGYFDFIVCSLVLEYMKTDKDLNLAVSELKRVLGKGGILIVTTPHKSMFTTFVREQIISRILPKKRNDKNFIMGIARDSSILRKLGFKTRGCLGWVTYKALNKERLSKFLDIVFWNIPFFSGTLVGIYEKK